jgi:uncharacterized damage-inducible protein DinB
MLQMLAQLFTYARWADRRIFAALQGPAAQDPLIRFLLNHMVNAGIIWYHRLETGESQHPLDYLRDDLATSQADMEEVYQWYLDLLEEVSEVDLQQLIHYHNSRGGAFENSKMEVLLHVVNHSTHHRAQVAARIRALGLTPPSTDLIFFFREKEKG